MKKMFAALLAVLMLTGVLCGCEKETISHSEKLTIVTTVFPSYDWVRNILGEKAGEADLTLLLDQGVDLHSFQPSADDIIRISQCDLLIYVGGESDQWVEDALKETDNPEMIVINLLDVLGDQVREEELIEGMGAGEHADGSGEEAEIDEHVWLSLKNAAILIPYIRDALIEADPKNAAICTENAAAYLEKLEALDQRYQDTVDNAPVRTDLSVLTEALK